MSKDNDSKEPTRWEKADIAGKFFLGSVGLILSAIVTIQGIWNHQEENARNENASKVAAEERLVKEFQAYYTLARQNQTNVSLALLDLDLAGAVAQTLAAEPYARPTYRDATSTYRKVLAPPPEASAGKPALATTDLQAGESAAGPAPTADPDGWFAVLRSYPVNEAGKQEALGFAGRIANRLPCVEVWRTKVSDNYAVVAGGRVGRAVALTNAQRARSLEIAPDAFTQADRGWRREASCKI